MSARSTNIYIYQGRGPYEDHVVDWAGDGNPPNNNNGQIYNEHGHPRNPETRRREREAVRSANEVMQVTGVVEDLKIAREKAFKFMDEKNHETYTGLRLMELGRASLVVGVWGVLGLRRRILVRILLLRWDIVLTICIVIQTICRTTPLADSPTGYGQIWITARDWLRRPGSSLCLPCSRLGRFLF